MLPALYNDRWVLTPFPSLTSRGKWPYSFRYFFTRDLKGARAANNILRVMVSVLLCDLWMSVFDRQETWLVSKYVHDWSLQQHNTATRQCIERPWGSDLLHIGTGERWRRLKTKKHHFGWYGISYGVCFCLHRSLHKLDWRFNLSRSCNCYFLIELIHAWLVLAVLAPAPRITPGPLVEADLMMW